MHAAILVFSIVVSGTLGDLADPTALTDQLGSPRFAQREAAELALSQLGRGAIPALRGALTSRDPEVRSRAAAILRRIEAALLVEPTQVQLRLADAPITEAVDAINKQAGLKLTLAPEIPAIWANRRVSVESAQPLPFWRAIDALCEAGQLHYVFGGQSDFDLGDSAFPLYDGFAANRGVFDDQGPFRIQLASLHCQSEVHLSTDQSRTEVVRRSGPTATNPSTVRNLQSKQFFLQMLVGAEPRLSVAPAGPVKLLEAVDDQGRSLVMPPRSEIIQHESGYLGVNPSPLVHIRLDLAYPDQPAARLKKVKGLIPLIVSTRQPDPLVVPLAGASNKTFPGAKVVISVGDVHLGQPDQVSTIELSIKSVDKTLGEGAANDPEAGAIRSVVSPQQLEVLDSAGRMIPWFPSSSFYNGEEAKLTLTLLDRGAAPMVPTTIRYHDLIRDRAEVPFEFRDLPMP